VFTAFVALTGESATLAVMTDDADVRRYRAHKGSGRERAGEKKRRKPMSHNVVPPLKSPAPPADEATTLWKHLKRLGTLLSTEEVFHSDGTSKRVTRVLRSRHM
jgi:hypothetical protein